MREKVSELCVVFVRQVWPRDGAQPYFLSTDCIPLPQSGSLSQHLSPRSGCGGAPCQYMNKCACDASARSGENVEDIFFKTGSYDATRWVTRLCFIYFLCLGVGLQLDGMTFQWVKMRHMMWK